MVVNVEMLDVGPYDGLSLHDLVQLFPDVDANQQPTSSSHRGSIVGGPLEVENNFGDDVLELFVRASRSVTSVHAQERTRLYAALLTLDAAALDEATAKAHALYSDSKEISSTTKLLGIKFNKSSVKVTTLDVTKHQLDFGLAGGECPVDEGMTDEIRLSCAKGTKAKFKFETPLQTKDYTIDISPTWGKVSSKTIPPDGIIKVTLVLKTVTHVKVVLAMSVEDGPNHFFPINVKSKQSVFGAPLEGLTLVDDRGMRVPPALKALRQQLVQVGLGTEGIFREKADDNVVLGLKRTMNSTDSPETDCTDPHALAQTIKLFFRNLPDAVFAAMPNDVIMGAKTQAEAIRVYEEYVEGSYRDLAQWLLDFIVDVVADGSNKMSPQTMSIALSPNMFSHTASEGLSIMEAVNFNQQSVGFFRHLIEWTVASKS